MSEKPSAVKHVRGGRSSAARWKPTPKRKVTFNDDTISILPPDDNDTEPSKSHPGARPSAASQSKPFAPRGIGPAKDLTNDLFHPKSWQLSYRDQVLPHTENYSHDGPSTLPTPGNLFVSPQPEATAISLPYTRCHSTDLSKQPLYMQGNLDNLTREVAGSILCSWAAHYDRLHKRVRGLSEDLGDHLATVDDKLNEYKQRIFEHEAFLANFKAGQQ